MSKTILITGATRGLGLETARKLLDLGHNVVITGRDGDKLDRLKRELEGRSGNLSTLHMDVTEDESVYDASHEFRSLYSKLDVLINNAGIFVDSNDSTDVTVKTMKKTLETNLYGPLRVSQAFLDLLYASDDGRIINISSGMGGFSEMMGGSAAYRISKTALNSLTSVMSADLNNAIKVVALCPGWVQTDMGGSAAPRNIDEGVAGIVNLATREQLESGKFYRDGVEIPW